MSYSTIKNYFIRRLSTHGLFESQDKFSLGGDLNFDNKFVIENPETRVEDNDRRLNDRFYATRVIRIRIAKRISEKGGVAEYDQFQLKIEQIMKDLDNPENYGATCRQVIFQSNTVEPDGDYALATLYYIAEDELIYG